MTLNPEQLRKYMAKAMVTQKALAEKAGISQSNISLYLAGRISPRYDYIEKLAEALGCEPNDLCAEQRKSHCGDSLITVSAAAKCMGKSHRFVTKGLQTGVLDIGTAIKIKERYSYFIIPSKLREVVGAERYDKFFEEGDK